MGAALDTKPRAQGATPPSRSWRVARGMIAGSVRKWQDVDFGAAKRAEARIKRTRQSEAVIPSAPTATPVAVWANGAVLGLALKVSDGFRFFSAASGTDAFDGEIFPSVDAIREAAGN